jgi:hypothetical protein
MKKILILLVVLFLFALTIQVAFADPNPPNSPPTDGSCNMIASWWDPSVGDTGPGNAKGVDPEERGMYRVHNNASHPQGYTYGAIHMDEITTAHCG